MATRPRPLQTAEVGSIAMRLKFDDGSFFVRASLLACGLVLSACGDTTAREPEAAGESGGETVAEGPLRPTGPAPTFLPAGTKVMGRIHVARIRRSPLA